MKTPTSPAPDEALRNALLQLIAKDREAGCERSLAEYQALFPGHEALVAGEHAALSAADAAEPERVGPYVLVAELGRGGQGVVWRARDERLGREVAIKMLRSAWASDEAALARFRREARAASRLEHPGICAVHDSGVDDGRPFIVMRLVAGQGLDTWIAARRAASEGPPGRAEIERLAALFAKAARALQHAHEAGVLHRDIKPANVLVGEDGDPVLLDFGLARGPEEEFAGLTATGDLLGTPAYMAPEQLRGERPGFATDVYALGVSMYECLTLERPFDAPTRDGLYRRILVGEATPARRANPRIGRDLAVIVQTAMEVAPERRYASVAAMAEDLERYLRIEPIRARPVPPHVRVARFCRRNPLAAGVIAVVSLALLVVSLLFDDARQALADAQLGRSTKLESEIERLIERGFQVGFGIDHRRAVEHFERALALDPANRTAFAGRVLMEMPGTAGALALIEGAPPALALDPLLDHLRDMARGWGAAPHAEERALESDDDLLTFLEGHRVAGQFLPPIEPERMRAAEAWFRRAIRHSSRPRFHYWHSLMMAAHRAGDLDTLLEGEDALRHHWPDSPAALEAIAQFFFEQDPEKAVAAMQRSLEIEPTVAAWIGVSQWHLANGRQDEALRCLESAVALDPASGTAHFMHAQALRAAGHHEAADAATARAREIAPELFEYQQVLDERAAADVER